MSVTYDEWKRESKFTGSALYHFTSISSMIEIVRTASIRLSDSRFLNDSSEFDEAKALVLEVAKSGKSEWHKHVSKVFENKFDSVYVASFCETHDSASQWGLYADSGKGCCIKFSISSSDNMHKPKPFSGKLNLYQLSRVNYNSIDDFRKLIESIFAEYSGKNFEENKGNCAGDMRDAVVFRKDPAFKSEQEVRLKCDYENERIFKKGYRVSNNMVVRYLTSNSNTTEISEPAQPIFYPIEEIIVSKILNRERVKKSIEIFLKDLNKDIRVNYSDVPYTPPIG